MLQGLLVAQPGQFKDPAKMVQLWVHESERVYCDGLVSVEDGKKFRGLLLAQVWPPPTTALSLALRLLSCARCWRVVRLFVCSVNVGAACPLLARCAACVRVQARKRFPQFNIGTYFATENATPLIFCHFVENLSDKVYDQIEVRCCATAWLPGWGSGGWVVRGAGEVPSAHLHSVCVCPHARALLACVPRISTTWAGCCKRR